MRTDGDGRLRASWRDRLRCKLRGHDLLTVMHRCGCEILRTCTRCEFFQIGMGAHGSLPLPLRACRVPMTIQTDNDSKD